MTNRFKLPLRRAAGRGWPIAKQWEGEVVFDRKAVSVILSEAKDLCPWQAAMRSFAALRTT